MKTGIKSIRYSFMVVGLSALILSGCVGLAPAPEAAMSGDDDKPATEKPHWSYSGEDGPEFWGNLSSDFAVCGTGVEQSPIDLTGASDADLADIIFNYSTSDLTVLNNGHTIQANYDSGSSIDLDGEMFNLLQFHMHAASEHTLNGEYFPLEIHLVHQAESGQLAVVGIIVKEGDANDALSPLWENLPSEKSDAMAVAGSTIDAAGFLPEDQSSFRYMGSLTTPPCSEQVRWHVLTTPITMSADQIAMFTGIYDRNNRPVQALNARELVLDTAE